MKKRALSLLMAVIMVVSLLPTAVWAAGETVAEIHSDTDFYGMNASGSYILMSDITITAPYGSSANKFKGTFDGNGHTITLNINSAGSHYQGAFAYIDAGGTVKNLITAGTIAAKNKNFIGGIAGMNCGTIEKCWNKTNITGKSNVGGIVGTNGTYSSSGAKIQATIKNCYNSGTINGTSSNIGGIVGSSTNSILQKCASTGTVSTTNAFRGGITGNSATSRDDISNCYWLASSCVGGKTFGAPYTDANSIIDNLGRSEWQVDASGNPILKFGPPEPGISLSASPSSLQMKNTEPQLTSTLTAKPENMTAESVSWSVKPEGVIDLADTNDDYTKTATAVSPGTATVTVTVTSSDGKTYTQTTDITVLPCFTTVELKNEDGGLDLAAGQTVQAIVNAYNPGSYDAANDDRLSYNWYWYKSGDLSTKQLIKEKTGRTCAIPTDFSGQTGSLSLYVEVYFKDRVALTGYHQFYYGDYALVSIDKTKLKIDTSDIKTEKTLTLPSEGSVNHSKITWESSRPDIIDIAPATPATPAKGKVTLPEEKTDVTLTATLTLEKDNKTTTFQKPFTITVWSKDQAQSAKDQLDADLTNALDEWYKLTPVYGTDTNVLTMVTNDLDRDDITVTMGTPVRTNATANMAETVTNIATDGTITYFYIDPNSDPMQNLQRFGTFSVPFTFTRDGVSVTRNISVTVYWDRDKVTTEMEKQIVPGLPKISGEVTEISPLPSTVNNKTWTGIEWSSNDNAITFKKPAATDPFGSWEVVVRGSSVAKDVTLTAKLTFRYTNDVTGSEKPITLLHRYTVTVPASADGLKYQKALDAVFGEGSLTDAATGAALDLGAVKNDIQFPTTRDLNTYLMAQYGEGFDGKFTPVLLTSDDAFTVREPDVANAARVAVYRPAVDEEAKTVTLTVKILDRPSGSGRDYANLPVLAEKRFTVTVQPLTEQEITNELALMAQAKAHYWDGIKNRNTAARDVTGDLAPFVEVYKQDGALVWVRDVREMRNSGIVPVAMNDWQELEAWRLFRSSNPAAVTHENLLVTQQFEGKAVTVTSALSSETLGRYGELYRNDPVTYADYAACDGLYYQPVSAELVVRGRNTANMVKKMIPVNGGTETRLVSKAVEEKVTVSFTLSGNGELWLGTRMIRDLDEGVTVFDVLEQLRDEDVLSFEHKGGYVQSITCNGKTLAELDEGKNSGWLYTVNGELPDVYMSAYGLKNGDSIRIYFTKDYTKEPGADRWKPVTPVTKTETVTNADGSVTKIETKPDGTTVETTTKPDGSTTVAETKPDGSVSTVEKRADGTEIKTAQPVSGEITASVSVPKSVGSTRVDIPVSKPTGSMVAVIVHPDGTEEIVKGSVVTETGIALRAEGDVRLKIIDNAKRFNDMANHWAKDAVEFASSRELFNGVGNDAFGPDLSMTRGMVGTVLARLAGADTAGGETWYAKGTVWAVENGISDGTAPEQPVTREQLAAMLYRYAGSPAVSGELSFDDTTVISIWAYDAVRWCVDNGILNGVGGNRMAPQDLARRGQVAAMLMRFLQATV